MSPAVSRPCIAPWTARQRTSANWPPMILCGTRLRERSPGPELRCGELRPASGEMGSPSVSRPRNEAVTAPHQLFEIPGGWRDCEVDLGRVRLRLTIPEDPDRLLDAQVAAHAAQVCPRAASRRIRIGRRSGRRPHRRPPPFCRPLGRPARRCWSLGCGVGLVGLAALVRGWHVTFSDYTRAGPPHRAGKRPSERFSAGRVPPDRLARSSVALRTT